MDALLGQGQAWTRALRAARARTLPHALLLAGGAGVGKTTAARALAQALLCDAQDSPEAACGACPACRMLGAGTHPDLTIVTPAADKREITVEQVRELQATLGFCAAQGRARVAVLDPADTLNEQGQNALLKTLEEPAAHTFLLLPATRPEGLLATVRSRVQRLPILPLAEEVVRQELERASANDPARCRTAAALAEGSLGLARQLLASEIDTLLPVVEQALGGRGALTPPELAKALLAGSAGRLEAERRARLALLLLRRRLAGALRAGADPALVRGQEAPYAEPSLDRWISRCEALCDAETDLGLLIPPEQVLSGALQRLRA